MGTGKWTRFFPLSLVLGGEGRGEGQNALIVGSSKSEQPPLTLTLSPAYRGEGTKRRGLGLVELLVSLAISAALLTATAVALDASFKAYGANQEQATLTQRARLSLNRILTYIRTCEAHQPHNATPRTSFVAGAIVTDTGIDMLKDDGTAISFIYDSTNQQLNFKQGTTTATMLNGVTSFTIKMEPMKSATNARSGGNYDLLMRATVLITLKTTAAVTGTGEDVGKQSLTISSSVMPRRNVW